MVNLKGKRILVTGGAGFLGSHLVKKLHSLGSEVFVIDIAILPQTLFSLENLSESVHYTNLDIRDKDSIFEYLKSHQFDIIFHLAAEPIVSQSYNAPLSTFETNIMGTAYILEAARHYQQLQALIVASSDKAYGKTDKAYNEDSPLKGDHPYDVSKSACDLISQTYYKTYGLPVVVTRFGNIYGEGDIHMDRIIPSICEAVAKKKTLEIRSNGKYVRDYLYVGDVVDGYLFLARNKDKTIGNAYNFSSPDTFSVLDLLTFAEKVLHTKINYSILNTAKNEIPYQHLDDTKVRKLGWKNTHTLASTLPQVFSWYQEIVTKK